MSIEFLDPGHEDEASSFAAAPRLASLQGATVGIISNGKEGTRRFFDALERELVERHGVAKLVRVTKANYSAPAGDGILSQARHWDAAITGVGD